MVPRSIIALACAVPLFACAGEEGPPPSPTRTVGQAIIGGETDDPSSGGVALMRGNSSTFVVMNDTCSASLIAPNVALTARHCVERTSTRDGCSGTFTGVRTHAYYAIRIDADLTAATESYAVSEIRTPAGNAMCDDDLAVLVLASNIPDAALPPIAPRLGTPPVAGEVYTAVGYGGSTAQASSPDGTRRRRTGLTVLCVGATCGSPATWIGVGATCGGDSGGPAIDAKGEVIGVAIRGNNCLSPNSGAAYVRPDAHATLLVKTALEAAKLGAYAAPAWAVLPPTPPDAGPSAPPPADGGATASAAESPAPLDSSVSPATPASTSGCAMALPAREATPLSVLVQVLIFALAIFVRARAQPPRDARTGGSTRL